MEPLTRPVASVLADSVQQKSRGLSGSSDTRSTPENDNKIPKRRFCACHQLWGQDGLSFPEGVSGWGAKGELDLDGMRKLAVQK